MQGLDTPERVHYAMLQGAISRITPMQCAHTWGAKAVEELNYAEQLRGDLKTVSDVLMDYGGATPWEQARKALEKIEWLRMELMISRRHEQAFKTVLEGERAELLALRSKLRYARIFMEANDPQNARFLFGPDQGDGNEQKARQTAGPTGEEQEREGE